MTAAFSVLELFEALLGEAGCYMYADLLCGCLGGQERLKAQPLLRIAQV